MRKNSGSRPSFKFAKSSALHTHHKTNTVSLVDGLLVGRVTSRHFERATCAYGSMYDVHIIEMLNSYPASVVSAIRRMSNFLLKERTDKPLVLVNSYISR